MIRYGNDRYFPPWEYNAVRMVDRLADLVEEEGGTVDRHGDATYVHTTGYDEDIYRLREKVGTGRARAEDLVELRRFEGLREDAPVEVTRFIKLVFDICICFTLDGCDYRFETDGSPFFRDAWSRSPHGTKGELRMVKDSDMFYYDDAMFSPVAPEDAIDRAARSLLGFLKGDGQREAS